MSVSNELPKPETEGQFEALCLSLYRRIWKDPTSSRMGRSGQPQFGVDIVGLDGNHAAGVQCKHYNNKQFTFKTVEEDVRKADAAGLKLNYLVFATTASSNSAVVRKVFEMNSERLSQGLFTVRIDYWDALCEHLREHPDIAKTFIPGFPGGSIEIIRESAVRTLEIVEESATSTESFQVQALVAIRDVQIQLGALRRDATTPDARGDEADPSVVRILDMARDRIRGGRTQEAKDLLEDLGDPALFSDTYSRFRWYTNRAAVDLQEGNDEVGADRLLKAFDLAPDQEKAHANKVHALKILKRNDEASDACARGLQIFPESIFLWGLKLHIDYARGEAHNEDEIPASILESNDMLFSRSRLESVKGNLERALILMERCLEKDSSSMEARRAYLADALMWITADPILAFHGQTTHEQLRHLKVAVAHFEPVERTVASLQSDHISQELSNNLCVAFQLLDQGARSRSLAQTSLDRHPLSEGLLRIRLNELEFKGDIDAIKALTDDRHQELPNSTLAGLVEISANSGNVTWCDELLSQLHGRNYDARRLVQLGSMRAHALLISGQTEEATQQARAYAADHPEDILANVVGGQTFRQAGHLTKAYEYARRAKLGLAQASISSLEIMLLADLFYDLRKFDDAASVYALLVKFPRDDVITRRLMISLLNADQRWKLKELLLAMEPKHLAHPQVRRIQINLLAKTGEWDRLQRLLAPEVECHKDDIDLAIAYVSALYRAGHQEQLKTFLKINAPYQHASPEMQFEFAKFQIANGASHEGFHRLLQSYKEHPQNATVAGYFLGPILMGEVPDLDSPVVVGPNTAVFLKTESDEWWVAIDADARIPPDSWPELVGRDSKIAMLLNQRRTGETVSISRGLGIVTARIDQIKSLMAFAAEKAHQVIGASASPEGPLRSVRVIRQDGELDLETFIQSARIRREFVEHVLEQYRSQKSLMSTMAHALDIDPIALMSEWNPKDGALFVCQGTSGERNEAHQILGRSDVRYVIDLLTIAEIVRLGVAKAVVQITGKLLVPQSMLDHTGSIEESLGMGNLSGSLSEANGKLQMVETGDRYFRRRKSLYKQVRRFIDHHCEVVPAFGPKEVSLQLRELHRIPDMSTRDVIYLCLERGAVLLSEDGILRVLAGLVGVGSSVWLQPVLQSAAAKHFISKKQYAFSVVAKIRGGREFTTFNSRDLLQLALAQPTRVSKEVLLLIKQLSSPTLELTSGAALVTEFFLTASRELRGDLVAQYALSAQQALKTGRPGVEQHTDFLLASTLQKVLGRNGRRLKGEGKYDFGRLLCRRTTVPPHD